MPSWNRHLQTQFDQGFIIYNFSETIHDACDFDFEQVHLSLDIHQF